MGTQGEDRGKVAREVTGQRRVAFTQPAKGAGGEFGVKPKQQVNGCAVRGLMGWLGAEGSQREARKRREASARTWWEATPVPTMEAAVKRRGRVLDGL